MSFKTDQNYEPRFSLDDAGKQERLKTSSYTVGDHGLCHIIKPKLQQNERHTQKML